MSTFYLWILASGTPVPFNTDSNNRVMFSINLTARARAPIADWLGELVRLIINGGFGVAIGQDIFIGPAVTLPQTDGPFIQLRDTTGAGSLQTHNGDRYENPACQIVVRALDYTVAQTLATSIWRALDGLHNVTVAA